MIGFEHPAILSLLLLSVPALTLAWKRSETEKKVIGATKALTVALLVLAAASPFIQTQDELRETPKITVLDDDSRSASLMKETDLGFRKIEVEREVIAAGNSSDLRKGLMRNVKGNHVYLLSSDLRSSTSLEGLAEKFRQKNATIHAIKPEMEKEASVSVSGPGSTVPEARNVFHVKVHSTGKVPRPEVYLDGEKVELERAGNSSWKFSESFSEVGSHRIRARIEFDDSYPENNVFYKTVRVREKPQILVLGEKGSMGEKLEKFYRVEYRSSVPEDLSDYYSVIAKKKFREEKLADYLVRGNGLVYTGKIEEKNFLLPLKPVSEESQSEGAKIVFAIDVSVSTGESDAIKKSIRVAYSLVDRLPFNNRAGAVAYNRNAYVLSKPKPLATNRRKLKNKISKLEPSGPSFHHRGLKGAKKLLNGTGNIVLISDGKIGGLGEKRNVPRKLREVASDLNVRLITVGVGEDKNEDLLQEIAWKGNGFYLDSTESSRLNFVFSAGGAASKASQLVVVNRNHFITEGLETDAAVAGVQAAKTKDTAELLVTTTGGKPFLASWRYGLGRVAAFTSRSGTPQRVLNRDPLLLTRAVSWSVGSPQRKMERWIRIEDARRGSRVEVKASYDLPGLKRQGEDLYTGELSPEKLGFHRFEGNLYGFNYNRELQEIGYSTRLEDFVESTGGEVFRPDQKQAIAEAAKSFSQKKVQTKKPVGRYFILAAMIVFLSEIGYRKLNGKK